jgi:hypothetical protein
LMVGSGCFIMNNMNEVIIYLLSLGFHASSGTWARRLA